MAPSTADKTGSKRGSCSAEASQPSPVTEGGRSTAAKTIALDGADSVVKGEDEAISATGSSHDGKRPDNVLQGEDNSINQGEEQLHDKKRVDAECAGAETPKSTAVVKDQTPSGAANAFSSLATGMLRPKVDDGRRTTRVGKAAAAISSGAGRERREEARRHAELYEVCACA